MGRVYRATDTRLGRTVAIKILKSDHTGRFQREARAIATLQHPNICQLFDVGPNYLVMEFIDGVTLRGPLPLDLALRYGIQICDALRAAHAKSITHRDLKPENILVTPFGVKLLDFGLAKTELSKTVAANEMPVVDSTTWSNLTEPGAILGTAAYMSPEQAKGEQADARSDIFSFGSVFYEMLSGRRAFLGASAVETMAAIIRDEPAPLDLPPGVAAILRHCLCKLPDDRSQRISEVSAALRQAQVSHPSALKTDMVPKGDASLAVLPFATLSADKENEYFSDGLAEDILTLLSRIPGLRVIARTSAFAFRGKEQDIRQIAQALGVSNVLEGSVRRAGNRLRVTAQLIQAKDGMPIWSERFDREITDVFAIQDEIGRAISEALKVRLAPPAQPVSIEAYQYYLRGQYHRVHYTPESLEKAKENFERALQIEPDYSLAYSGLAAYYFVIAGLAKSPKDALTLAKTAALKALTADSSLSEPLSVLGAVASTFDYNWREAEGHFRHALAAEPVSPLVRYRYASYYLLPLQRLSEAMEQHRMALEADPLSIIVYVGMVLTSCVAKEYDEAIGWARRGLDLDPNSYLLLGTMGIVQLSRGSTMEAIATLERALALAPLYTEAVGYLAVAYSMTNDSNDRDKIKGLPMRLDQTFSSIWYHAAVGDIDAMFEALEAAYARRDRQLLLLPSVTILDPFRSDPRFKTILEKMNLQ